MTKEKTVNQRIRERASKRTQIGKIRKKKAKQELEQVKASQGDYQASEASFAPLIEEMRKGTKEKKEEEKILEPIDYSIDNDEATSLVDEAIHELDDGGILEGYSVPTSKGDYVSLDESIDEIEESILEETEEKSKKEGEEKAEKEAEEKAKKEAGEKTARERDEEKKREERWTKILKKTGAKGAFTKKKNQVQTNNPLGWKKVPYLTKTKNSPFEGIQLGVIEEAFEELEGGRPVGHLFPNPNRSGSGITPTDEVLSEEEVEKITNLIERNIGSLRAGNTSKKAIKEIVDSLELLDESNLITKKERLAHLKSLKQIIQKKG